jgi:membrane protein
VVDIGSWPSRFAAWWVRTVWELPRRETSVLRAYFLVWVRAWENAVRCYESDQMAMRAHALTFRTLLGVIPFLAVAFSLFHAFGGLESAQHQLQEAIMENLAPGSAAALDENIRTFVWRQTGAVGGIGVVGLFFIVVSLLTYIEKTFNSLWNVEKERPFFRRFTMYWAIVTVGPVVAALSFSMTSPASSQALSARIDALWPQASGLLEILFRQSHWVFTWIGMTLLYVIVPNTRVSWRAALGGGLVAGVLWEMGKLGFTWASRQLIDYSTVYGSLGTLPLFLLWIQIGWQIVLFCCKVTYGLQYSRALQEERIRLMDGPVVREMLALRAMVEVARAFVGGDSPPSAEQIASHSPVSFETTHQVLNRLVEAGLLLSVPDNGHWPQEHTPRGRSEHVDRYFLARDASLISLEQVVDEFRRGGPSSEEVSPEDPVARFVQEVMDRAEAASSAVTSEITLADAVRRVNEPPSQGT